MLNGVADIVAMGSIGGSFINHFKDEPGVGLQLANLDDAMNHGD